LDANQYDDALRAITRKERIKIAGDLVQHGSRWILEASGQVTLTGMTNQSSTAELFEEISLSTDI
jgi:hypothetical protein